MIAMGMEYVCPGNAFVLMDSAGILAINKTALICAVEMEFV